MTSQPSQGESRHQAMSRKKRQKIAGDEAKMPEGGPSGTAAASAPQGAVAAAAAASSAPTSSKRPRPTSPPQPEEQGSKKSRTDAPPNETIAGDSVAASHNAAAGPSNASSRPAKQRPRPLLRIQRRNLVAGPFNPGGGYSYLTLRVDGGNGSGEVTAAALGDTFRSTLHQHLGLVGGSVPFDVLSIDSRARDEDEGGSSSRQARAKALVRIPLQYAREVRAALVLGGLGGAGRIRLGLAGSEEETGSVWTLRSQAGGGGGGSAWMKRLEEGLLA